MHIEAMRRIKNKLCRNARKGVDPAAYCGLSCNHCFLGEWCGSCRTEYNVCSFATLYEDKKCPNAVCCREKNIDGCYECSELEGCTKASINRITMEHYQLKHRLCLYGNMGKKLSQGT